MARLYTGAGWCERRVPGVTHIHVQSFSFIGNSQDEAVGWAFKELRQRYPQGQGYQNHDVGMYPIDRSDVEIWLAAYDQPEGEPHATQDRPVRDRSGER